MNTRFSRLLNLAIKVQSNRSAVKLFYSTSLRSGAFSNRTQSLFTKNIFPFSRKSYLVELNLSEKTVNVPGMGDSITEGTVFEY